MSKPSSNCLKIDVETVGSSGMWLLGKGCWASESINPGISFRSADGLPGRAPILFFTCGMNKSQQVKGSAGWLFAALPLVRFLLRFVREHPLQHFARVEQDVLHAHDGSGQAVAKGAALALQ